MIKSARVGVWPARERTNPDKNWKTLVGRTYIALYLIHEKSRKEKEEVCTLLILPRD